MLIVVVGVALWLVVLFPLVLIGAVTGLLGIGAGAYYKDLLGSVTAALGLALIGIMVWSSLSNLNNF